MKREPQLSALLVCIGVVLLAFLVNASSAAAQANGDTNSQNNNGRGDDDNRAFAVKQGPGTNTGNCPALPPATDDITLPRVYCPYPPGLIPSDLTTESEAGSARDSGDRAGSDGAGGCVGTPRADEPLANARRQRCASSAGPRQA